MKTNYLLTIFIVLNFLFLFTNCKTNTANDGTVTINKTPDGNILTIANFHKIKDTITYNLSDFVTDFKIVRFENSDKAIFKLSGAPVITDKYIGIRQSHRPFLLFNHDGKLLCEIGSSGGGPGEYLSLYDEVINEKLEKVYLAPFFNSPSILEYNIDGTFIRNITIKGKLNKPKIKVDNDGNIAVIHMPFDTNKDKFIALQYDKDVVLKQEVKDVKRFIVPAKNKDGLFTGFSNEIFSYRNTSNFDFTITNNDTLFHYIPEENKIYPKFTINFGGIEDVPLHIYNEIPRYYLAYIRKKGVIIVDMKQQTSKYIKIVNDFFGHMNAPKFNFNKGWFFQMFEPEVLIEAIQKRLAKSDCSSKDRQQLERLLKKLDVNDNNVMFIAKLN